MACLLLSLLPKRRRRCGDQESRLVGTDVLQAVGQRALPQDTVALFQAIGLVPIVGADRALQEQMTLLARMRACRGP